MLEVAYIVELNKLCGGSVLNRNSLHSALSSWQYYENIEEQISSIVRGLIKNHAFTDGNKRTAFLVFVELCNIYNILPNKDSLTIIRDFVNIAENHYSVGEIKKILFG